MTGSFQFTAYSFDYQGRPNPFCLGEVRTSVLFAAHSLECHISQHLLSYGRPFLFNQVKALTGQLDLAMAALIKNLKDRGLLDSTLVICMGEFGRSPNREGADGRGHYAEAWSAVLAGAGLKTGRIVGATDREGGTAVERPTSTVDFLATVCKAISIDYTKTLTTPDNRPIRIVDKNQKIVTELF